MKVLFLAIFFLPSFVWAYGQFIGKGEASCIQCHYNPFGSTALTDYGRINFATEISAQHFGLQSTPRESLAKSSSFLGTNLPRWFRPHALYRGQHLANEVGRSSQYQRTMTNRALVGLTLRAGKDNNLVVSYSGSYHPRARTEMEKRHEDISDFTSQEYFLSLSPTPRFRLAGGFMDKVFGLKIPESWAYSRTLNEITNDDQVHQGNLWTHFWGMEIGLSGFVGNLHLRRELRTRGASIFLELTPWQQFRPGISLMNQTTTSTNTNSAAVHSRVSMGEGSSLLFEAGGIRQNSKLNWNEDSTVTVYEFFQAAINLFQGFNVIHTFEAKKVIFPTAQDLKIRLGPGLQYYFLGRSELRLDVYNQRTIYKNEPLRDSWNLVAQLNFWP